MKLTKSRDKLHKEKITFTGSKDNISILQSPEKADFSFTQDKEGMDRANKTEDQFTEEHQVLTRDNRHNAEIGAGT